MVIVLGAVLDGDKNRSGSFYVPPAGLHFNQDEGDRAAKERDDVV